MSNVSNTVNYDLTAQDAGASSAFAKLGKQMEMAAAKAQILKDNAGFAGKELDKFAKIGGIALLGRGLADATEKAAKLVDEFRAGQVSIQEMGLELLKTVPIVGEFAKAGENIRNIFDPNMRAAKADEARAKEDTKNIEHLGKVQAGIEKSLREARNQNRTSNIGVGGSEGDKAAESARQQFNKNMELVKELEGGLRDAGIIGGKDFEKLEELKRTYENTYSAALLAARVEDEKARLKIEEDIRKKEKERQEKLAKEAKERAEKMAKQFQEAENLRYRIVTEDRIESLGERRDLIEARIKGLKDLKDIPLRTAKSFTDTGASALLAAKQPKSDDPTVKALRESNASLKSIDKEIKGVRTDAKNRDRAQDFQEIFN
jgi:hypothetical protein